MLYEEFVLVLYFQDETLSDFLHTTGIGEIPNWHHAHSQTHRSLSDLFQVASVCIVKLRLKYSVSKNTSICQIVILFLTSFSCCCCLRHLSHMSFSMQTLPVQFFFSLYQSSLVPYVYNTICCCIGVGWSRSVYHTSDSKSMSPHFLLAFSVDKQQ